MPNTKTLKAQIRAECEPQVAEFLIRNLHKPLNAELLRTAYKMMAGEKKAFATWGHTRSVCPLCVSVGVSVNEALA